MTLSNRVSIITGASQGIGEAIAFELSREGARVILVDIQKEKLEEVTHKIVAKGGVAFAYEADVSRMDRVIEIVETIIREHQKVDHLINNAGITKDSLLMRMKEDDWDSVVAVNLKGVFNFSRAVVKNMVSNRYGRIVNISSIVGLMGNPGQGNYSASKAGIIGFTKSIAKELASRQVTVNAVAPGYISTPMTEKLPEAVKKVFIDMIPMKRFGSPKEIAYVVKFLLSDEAAYITGQVVSVNGGMLM